MGKFEIAVIVCGVAILFFYSQIESPRPSNQMVSWSQSGQSPDSKLPAATDAGKIYGRQVHQIFDAVAWRAIDGDSLEVTMPDGDRREVRLASIDAPERNQTSGQAAHAHLAAIIKGQTVRVFQTDTDRYGRVVAFVSTHGAGIDVNASMLSDGYAWHAIKHSTDPTLAKIQREAKAARRGLWSQPSPVAPWDYRK